MISMSEECRDGLFGGIWGEKEKELVVKWDGGLIIKLVCNLFGALIDCQNQDSNVRFFPVFF